MLGIEIIEGCNFECYFCRAKTVEKKIYLDFELFKSIVLQAKDLGIDRIKLTPCRGEPFLHPRIYDMLEFANEHMRRVDMFTNATVININKLKQVNLSRVNLCVSQYGSNPDDFTKLTCKDERIYKIFHRRLAELNSAGIKYTIFFRGIDYEFDYDGGPIGDSIDFKTRCQYHQQPKVLANGDITFCMFAREEMQRSKSIRYANLNDVSLKEAIESPLRYKFMESQSICKKHCGSGARSCHNEVNIVSLKFLSASKKQYQADKDRIDQMYLEMENEVNESSI